MPSKKSKEPSVVVKEIHVRRDSEHSHHRSRRKRLEEDKYTRKDGEKGRTRSSGGEKSRRTSGPARPFFWRRATDAAESIRTRSRLDMEPSRRDLERMSSSRDVYERTRRRDSLPLRSEKRSISATVGRGSKARPSATRSASYHDPTSAKLASTSRPSLHRSQTTTRKFKSATYPQSSRRPEKRERAQSTSGKSKRPPSIFGSVMSSSRPKKPVKQVECVTCMEEFPASEGVFLEYCKHYWCPSCIKRVFELSTKDIQNMPPKCCKNKPIQPEKANHLFNSTFRRLWNAKYAEWSTKDRLYCPGKGCGTWIKPEHIKLDGDKNPIYGKCSKCSRKVCPKCNNRYHPTRSDCPKDPETAKFIRTAKENGWQQCGKCGVTVERTEGCHHMKCPPPCKYEFCILCGAEWKTCQCPWFSNEQITQHMNDVPGGVQHPHMAAINYQQEMAWRRDQERRDEDIARRLQMMGFEGEVAIGHIGDFRDPNFNGMPVEVTPGGPRRVFVGQDFPGNRRWAWPGAAAQHAPAPPRAPAAPVRRARGMEFGADEGAMALPDGMGPLQARASQMAGVNGGQREGGRVDEWRRWVGEPGGPEGW